MISGKNQSEIEWSEAGFPPLPVDWKTMIVDEIKSTDKKAIISGPFGSNISSKYFVEYGIPVIRGNNLSLELSIKFKDDGFVYITPDKANELNTWATKNDLIFTAVGTLGQVGFLSGNEKFEKYIISNKQLRLTVNKQIIEPLFAYYWFASEMMVDQIIQRNTGSSVPLINLSVLKSLVVPVPPLEEQKAITSLLSSLDDKIDLLHRQNKTLEAMAETLFRQWFVEEAQEDWVDGCISDLCLIITKGTTPTTLGHQFKETGINFVKAESITDTGDFIFDKFAKISTETHAFLNRSILQEGDVLCSIAGTIGRVAIVAEDILPANTNQAIAIMRINPEKCYPEFLYLFMKSSMFREIMDGKIVHAVQPNLSLGEIGNTPIKIPPLSYLFNSKGMIQSIFLKKKENYCHVRILEKLRNILLPKLMSGEVRVEYEN